jgi:hypothetical protein
VSFPLSKKYQTAKLNLKILLIALFGSEGIIDHEFLLGGATVSAACCVEMLSR